MSKKGQNFLQSWWEGYKNFDPVGAIQNRMDEDKALTQQRSEYLEDQFLGRVDPTRPERGVKPSIVESVLLGVDRNDFSDAGGRINIRQLKKTEEGQRAQELGLTINPDSTKEKLKRRNERKTSENQYKSLTTRNKDLDVTTLTNEQLPEEIRKASNQQQQNERYGIVGPDGKTRTGGSISGQMEIERFNNESDQSKASVEASNESVRASQANTALNSTIAKNDQINQLNADDWKKYVYGDSKREAQIERDYQGKRDDAQFDANLETIKLQNAAEMERYEMMLQNDREVRQGESISDLMAALTMLGGAFML